MSSKPKPIRELEVRKSVAVGNKDVREACGVAEELAVKYMSAANYDQALAEFKEIELWNQQLGNRLQVAKVNR